MSEAEATFTAKHTDVAAARRFVTNVLTGWNAAVFDWSAVTLVSELATNAVLHARTGFTVTLRLTGDVLRLAVSDQSNRLPQQRHYGLDATTGRGMHLLRDLAASNGVDVTALGKTVWCELRASAGSGAGEDGAALTVFLAASADAAPDEDLGAFLADLGPGQQPGRPQDGDADRPASRSTWSMARAA
ncbi:MAG: ATP-binding protein [Actinomycetes bacterium]